MKSERRRSPRLSLSVKIMPVLGLPSYTGKGLTLPSLDRDLGRGPSGQAKSTDMFEQVGPGPHTYGKP